MTRFYFDIWDGEHSAYDDFGVECHSVNAASVQARIALTELAREILPSGGQSRHLKITVRDTNRSLFSLKLHFEAEAHA